MIVPTIGLGVVPGCVDPFRQSRSRLIELPGGQLRRARLRLTPLERRTRFSASIVGLVRLVHPFPSLLTASATAAIPRLAECRSRWWLGLGSAMLAIQLSIGALNDSSTVTRTPAGSLASPSAVASSRHGLRSWLPRVGAERSGSCWSRGVRTCGASPPRGLSSACSYAYHLRLSRTALWSAARSPSSVPILPIRRLARRDPSRPPGCSRSSRRPRRCGLRGERLVHLERDAGAQRRGPWSRSDRRAPRGSMRCSGVVVGSGGSRGTCWSPRAGERLGPLRRSRWRSAGALELGAVGVAALGLGAVALRRAVRWSGSEAGSSRPSGSRPGGLPEWL